MAWATEQIELTYGDLRLRSLRAEDIGTVAEAIHDPEGWSGRVWGMDTQEKICEMLRLQLAARERGEGNPFVYFVGGEVAGISRFLNLAPQRRGLEIGGTCVAPRWRNTFVNTEVKRLLLDYCFGKLGVVRAEFRVDCANFRSQLAVLRLGATFEGKIRHWQVRKDGRVPDGMLYSITHLEWPAVEARLLQLREQERPASPFLPERLASPRLRLRLYRLADAPELLALALRNRESLVDSFPRIGNLHELGEAEAYVARCAHEAAAGEAFFYGVWAQESGRQIGQLQIKGLNWKARTAELGYFLDADFRRRGIGAEMVQAALEELEGRQGFRRVTLRALPRNEASIGLARKLGFSPEGLLCGGFVSGRGRVEDIALFARLGGSRQGK